MAPEGQSADLIEQGVDWTGYPLKHAILAMPDVTTRTVRVSE